MRRPPSAALRVASLDYLAFYRTNWSEGTLCVCNERAVKAPARRFLAAAASCPGEGFSQFNVYSIAEKCLRAKGEQGARVLPGLIRAFEFLELLCVNLFLSPWRKEIRSLKTFTGNFVYCMQSVLPKCVTEELLEKIGYIATTATEFSLVRKLNEEEAEQAAFEIFLARIECEDLLEITKDVRDSDLRDVLQKRARKYWHPGEVDRLSQRKECMLNRGGNNTPGYTCPQQRHLTNGQQAFEKVENTELEGELSLSVITADPQLVSSEFSSSNQSQASASTTSGVKSSDSEDFLTKYSDIVIGQKPLHISNLPLKVSEDKNQPTGLIGTTLGLPAKAPHLQTLLSPNSSGPQALAILNNVALEVSGDHGTHKSSRETIESEIREAMDCLSDCGSHSIDQPKELKGRSSVQYGNKLHIVMSISREEDYCTSDQFNVKEDHEGALGYPIEETAQEESTVYNEPQECSHSRVKLTDTPVGDKEDFSVDLYSSHQFPNTTENAYPTTASNLNRRLAGISSPHQAHERYGHVGEPLSATCTIFPSSAEIEYPDGIPDLQGRGDLEGHSLQSSFSDEDAFQTCIVKMNESIPEDYVLISKD